MKSYNGFPPNARARQAVWLRKRIRAGDVPAPSQCVACGQTEGRLQWHAEDYSEPFGAHAVGVSLCNRCHLWVHRRDTAPERWDAYRASVRKSGVRNVLDAIHEGDRGGVRKYSFRGLQSADRPGRMGP